MIEFRLVLPDAFRINSNQLKVPNNKGRKVSCIPHKGIVLFLVPFPKPPGTHALSCELTLGCSVDYLLGQSRWSPRPSMVTNIGQVGVQVFTYDTRNKHTGYIQL